MTEPTNQLSGSAKWIQRSLGVLLGLVVVVLLTCLIALIGLQLPVVRGTILGWAGASFEKASEVHLTASDFQISLRNSEVRLQDLELRADGSDSEPFVVIPETRIQLSWRSLLTDRPQIHVVACERAEIDLGAPLPQPVADDQTTETDLFPSLDIHRFELIEGSLRSTATPASFDEWLDRWQATNISLTGSLNDEVATLEIESTELSVESHRRPRIEANLTSRLSVDDEGSIEIQALELAGEFLDLTLEGHGRLDPETPFQASLEIRTDLANLVPDLTSSGHFEATGNITFTAAPESILTGDMLVSGRDLPAELLEPLLASSNVRGVRLERTQLDVSGDLRARLALANPTAEPADNLVSGEVQATWRRQDDPLLIAHVRTNPGGPSGNAEGITVSLQAEILPDADGRRHLSGTLLFPSWTALDQLRLEDVRINIQQDELAHLTAELGWSPEVLGGLQPTGSLMVSALADGPLASPTLELEARWQLDDRPVVELVAHATEMSNLVFEAELLPQSPGTRRIQGGWLFAGIEGLREGSFDDVQMQIDLPDLEDALFEVETILGALIPDENRLREAVATLPLAVKDPLEGSLRADMAANGALSSPTIELAATWVATDSKRLTLEASYEDGLLKLAEISGTLSGFAPAEQSFEFAAHGQARLEKPLRDATLNLQILDLLADIHQLDVRARLDGGTLSLDGSSPSIPGTVQATIPLAALVDILPEAKALEDLPLVFDAGSFEIGISELGLGRATEIGQHLMGVEAPNLEIAGLLNTLISFDPARPLQAVGTLEVEGLQIAHGQTRLESERNLRLDVDEGEIQLQPARLWVRGEETEAPLDLKLTAELDPDWRLGSEITSLVRSLDLDLSGAIDSALLTPFLAGGIAQGPVSFAARVSGNLAEPIAELRIDGPEASVVLPGRYRTQISAPEIEIMVSPAAAEIRTGRMRLNRGEVTLNGGVGDDQVLRLGARFTGVRYRLDHGLTVSADGDLELAWPREGRRRLSGTIDVERGSLRRDLRLERELIRMINPSDLAAGGSAFEESVDLDINLVTREGVRIKNNLADLRADWDLLRVRGTLADPAVEGSIDVDPGGLLTAYGQTVRIDQGSLIFSGIPGDPPRMDFETTTSTEDPRIRDQWSSVSSTGPDGHGPGGGFWDRYDPQSSSNAFQADEVATGLTSYFQNRFLRSISGGAPRVELSIQPLPLMGETDTTARVTMSYHLTPQLSYVLSQNPREAEGRTDILNLYNFAIAPSLRGQLFRNDQGNQGVTLQQMLELGGPRRAEDALPRLRSIDLTAPEGIRKRHVRRATGLRRGQPVAEAADFDIEIDMLDALTRRGFPAARVDVELETVSRNRVSVGIDIEPGTRVEFEFTGDQPQRRARRDIIALYQPTGLERSPALERVRLEAVRALRARGFLDPQVEVTSERLAPGSPTSDRIIRVHSVGGRQVSPNALEFPGLPDDVEQALAALFSSRLSRVELAMGEPAADRLLRQSLQTVGYAEIQILSRTLSTDGSILVVETEPGPRRHLTAVEIVGVEGELRDELDKVRVVQPSDPVSSGQIARTAMRMEDRLRERGLVEATVAARYEPSQHGGPDDIDLYFDVDSGREHRIGEIRTEGLANSSPRWVERISKLETGELLTDSAITQARRQLARTGVFQRIAIRRDEAADLDARQASTPITLELEEHPRYRVTYGIRAESTREVGVVADVGDLNFLGRGQTLGLRLLYATLERNARLYWSIPRVRQTNKNLEFFFEVRREELDDMLANVREAWAQMTFPVGRRSVHRLYTVYKTSETEDRSRPDTPAMKVVSPFSGWQVSFDTGERSFFETSTDRRTVFFGSDLSFASESLGSDYTGYGWFGQVKPQIPLVKMGASALVWVHNYRVGLREAQGDDELPFFDRLFAGGEFSVRGYPTNSLGPQTEDGTPLGGEAMFATNQELRFPVWSLLSGVAFFDAGNVWESRQAVESTLFKSIGLGLRADSPVGPLRLDFAYPLDRREGDPEYKIYFGLGQTF